MKKPKTQRTKKKKPSPALGARDRKRKVVSATGRLKPKAFATRPAGGKSKKVSPAPGACLASAVPLPELEAIPTQPLFAAPRHQYFLGGGVAMPAGFLPEGFVPANAPKPANYRAAEFRSYRTFPEGAFIRCVRYELKPECVGHDLKDEEMSHILAGNFFIQNGNDGPVLSVRCVCNSNLLRIGKKGTATCSKCAAVYVAPTDRTGLPIMNSQGMKNFFSPSALPRDRR
jgi:hypothetical protein